MYQGHKNWNVALWLSNDYASYQMVNHAIHITPNRKAATKVILNYLVDSPKTPDGAPYTYTSVRAALVGWEG